MGAPAVSVRCPTCGADLRVVLAAAPPTQWFPCPQCRNPVPVVVPRDPPPLYSWEVIPWLYPNLPPPRRGRWPGRPAAAIALAVVAVASVMLVVLLAGYGVQATAPSHYTVSGVVEEQVGGGQRIAAPGALVI